MLKFGFDSSLFLTEIGEMLRLMLIVCGITMFYLLITKGSLDLAVVKGDMWKSIVGDYASVGIADIVN